jgi:hypothetical protein
MPLHEGEKYRCENCNAQVSVVRSSDTRSLDFEMPRPDGPDTIALDNQNHINDGFRLLCCGKAMVRFCIKAAF